MKYIYCVACKAISRYAFTKGGVDYFECLACGSVFVPNGLSQASMVGGEAEVERNTESNRLRIARVRELKGDGCSILDFGCGNGLLVKDLQALGFHAFGYDKFNADYDKLPQEIVDIVTMIEVIEHLTFPFEEIGMMASKLRKGGFLMVESSFRWDHLSLNDVEKGSYCNPSIGHCSILSPKGLVIICRRYGLQLFRTINPNVWVFQKV
jgi:SAM-dependent methyltransferase